MIVTAFMIGFVGSLHCVGMCSPLAMAVSSVTKAAFVNRVVYNSGRILTYAVLGALAGAFGRLAGLTEIQNTLSIVLGGFLIIIGITGAGQFRIPFISSLLHHFSLWVKKVFSRQLKGGSFSSMALLGCINGLLPCGLTFLALAYCALLPGAVDGFLFMMLFGAGTLPAMLGLVSLLAPVLRQGGYRIQQFNTMFLIVMGLLLIVRSTSLDYRDLRPRETVNTEVVCP
ncbi:MAG: sulfite exporter TauE/SafE family protein [Cyclobacteriaceae bacterium]|nr:sulfite exporter TauE/SafE family protein [Cyclobacteriaceae bacterium]